MRLSRYDAVGVNGEACFERRTVPRIRQETHEALTGLPLGVVPSIGRKELMANRKNLPVGHRSVLKCHPSVPAFGMVSPSKLL